jgi:hypothetical protein
VAHAKRDSMKQRPIKDYKEEQKNHTPCMHIPKQANIQEISPDYLKRVSSTKVIAVYYWNGQWCLENNQV